MKNNLIIILLSSFIVALTSCKEEEKEDCTQPVPAEITYTNESYIVNEFSLYTEQGEINTEGLNPEDYFQSDHFESVSPESHLGLNVTIRTDSIEIWGEDFSNKFVYVKQGNTYTIFAPDIYGSLYQQGSLVENEGKLEFPSSYFSWEIYSGSDNTGSEWNYLPYHVNLDIVSSQMSVGNILDELTPSDTLLIYNYTVVFN